MHDKQRQALIDTVAQGQQSQGRVISLLESQQAHVKDMEAIASVCTAEKAANESNAKAIEANAITACSAEKEKKASQVKDLHGEAMKENAVGPKDVSSCCCFIDRNTC